MGFMIRTDRWSIVRQLSIVLQLSIYLAWSLLPDRGISAAEPRVPDRPAGLAATFDSILQRAEIGTDETFDDYKQSQNIIPAFIAPQGLRSLAQPPVMQTSGRVFLEFRWQAGRVSLTWRGELRGQGNEAQGLQKLTEILEHDGYSRTSGKLTTYLSQKYGDLFENREKLQKEGRRGQGELPRSLTFVRKNQSMREELLLQGFLPLVGGREQQCGGRFNWSVTSNHSGPPPSLEELLNVIPALTPVHLEPALYKRLKAEPAYFFSIDCMAHRPGIGPNTGWKFITTSAIRSELEDLLKQQGFVFGKEIKLSQPEHLGQRTQYTWTRQSDSTFASLITMADDKERMEVSCMAPQRP